MKKWSTLIYIVKKITKHKKDDDHVLQNFLAIADEEAPFSPSADSIRNILDFAKSYEVLNSDSAGHIELITN